MSVVICRICFLYQNIMITHRFLACTSLFKKIQNPVKFSIYDYGTIRHYYLIVNYTSQNNNFHQIRINSRPVTTTLFINMTTWVSHNWNDYPYRFQANFGLLIWAYLLCVLTSAKQWMNLLVKNSVSCVEKCFGLVLAFTRIIFSDGWTHT